MITQRTDRELVAFETFRSTPLALAIVVSVAVHAGLAAATFSAGAYGTLPNPETRLRATLLVPEHASAPEVAAVAPPAPAPLPVKSANAPSPRKLPVETVSAPPFTIPLAPSPAHDLEPVVPIGSSGLGALTAEAQPLLDRDRLGDLVTREINEFPVELDFPARIGNPIVARYPPQALADGREGSVAVWIVVSTDGTVEELHIGDGEEEFATMVVAALEGVRFVPAHNYLKPIRFPIALEFRFVIDPKAATASAIAEAASATAEAK